MQPKTLRDDQVHAYHLLRCLIVVAMADSVLADAEAEVLEHSVRMVGQIDAELWEETWRELQGDVEPSEVFEAVPDSTRLKRFILREMASIALADNHFHPEEDRLIRLAATAFGLDSELTRFVDWAHRFQAVFEEGESLLKGS